MSCVLDGKARDHIITATGKNVVIDTCWVENCGWETMVFNADDNGFIVCGTELDERHYKSSADADVGHTEMINKWMKEVLV